MPETCSSSTTSLYNVSSMEMKSLEQLSLKIELDKSPRMLMKLRAPYSILSVGGIPWHCITNASNCRHMWEIKSLKTGAKCHDGYLGSDKPNLEPDRCFFHPDESGKIILLGTDRMAVYALDSNEVSKGIEACKLKELYSITHPQPSSRGDITHTQSGRRIKLREGDGFYDDQYSSIQCLSFEDELDVMVITTLHRDVNTNNLHGVVNIHDNQTGKLFMRYQMNESWDCDQVHNVEMDRDIIYHLTKRRSQFVLYVHRLTVDPVFATNV